MSPVINRAAFFGVVLLVGGVFATGNCPDKLPSIALSVGGKAVTRGSCR